MVVTPCLRKQLILDLLVHLGTPSFLLRNSMAPSAEGKGLVTERGTNELYHLTFLAASLNSAEHRTSVKTPLTCGHLCAVHLASNLYKDPYRHCLSLPRLPGCCLTAAWLLPVKVTEPYTVTRSQKQESEQNHLRQGGGRSKRQSTRLQSIWWHLPLHKSQNV